MHAITNGGANWGQIGVYVTVAIFILGSAASGMKLYETRKEAKAALEVQRLEDVKKQAVLEATQVDPRQLAVEVAGLKRAVLGTPKTDYDDAKPGLVEDVKELRQGQKDTASALGVLTISVDELAALVRKGSNGNGTH